MGTRIASIATFNPMAPFRGDAMTKKETLRVSELYYRLSEHGFTFDEMETLRKASLQLHRWSERECNGEVERFENGLAYCRYGRNGEYITRARDMESAAKRHIDRILANHSGWAWYYQTDPRGCSVYLYRVDDPILAYGGVSIESCYNSIGIAIY